MVGSCFSGVPAAGGRSHRQAQVCSLGPLQSFLHAVCQRRRGELTSVFTFKWIQTQLNPSVSFKGSVLIQAQVQNLCTNAVLVAMYHQKCN